ncbi:MAG: LD-carboxypeptidase [Bacteroidetes bacterium]|nr:LD-carboxypeptidase [Bacteroidota bacterium]
MIRPPALQKGDKISIVAPARSIRFEEVYPSMKLFQKWGYEVVLGTNIFNTHDQFSGTDDQRAADLQQALDDESVKAIICARGGYGTVRIIDRLDFTRFCDHPKWIVGYSDITVIHTHVHERFGIETIHALMPFNIPVDDLQDDSTETLKYALSGMGLQYIINGTPLNREGKSEGILTGGNLSILYSLMGSVSEIQTEGKILFLEDVDEYLYHIDRMMMNLKRAGKLKNLRGLIIGDMGRMNDNQIPYGKTAHEIIADAVAGCNYPVCFNFQAGHGSKNVAMFLGRKITMNVGPDVKINFS